MKKNILFAAFAAVLFAACQQEIEPVEKHETSDVEDTAPVGGLTFKAVFEAPSASGSASAATRTALGENGLDVLWREHDAITLFDGDGEAYTAKINDVPTSIGNFVKGTRYEVAEGGLSADCRTATFTVSPNNTPAAEGKDVYYAFCPYVGDAAFDFGNQKLIAWLMRYQKGNDGDFSEQRGTAGRYMNFAAGKTTDPENEAIVFRNILCHLKFTVPSDMAGKITRIGVHTGAEDYLGGDQYVDLTGDVPSTSLRYGNVEPNNGSRYSTMYLFPDHDGGNSANITPGKTFEAGSYYMAVMPCELKSGLFVTFETEDGTICHKDHYAPSTVLLRNKVYDMGELTWNNTVAATGTGVSLPYAFSFLQVKGEDGDMVYSDKGSLTEGSAVTTIGGDFVPASGVIAVDKSNTSVTLSAQVTKGSPKNTSQQNLAYWQNNMGADIIYIGAMLNRKAVPYLPFENYAMLSVPLAEDMPEKFKISLGSCPTNLTYSIKEWLVMYSADGKTWIECPEKIVYPNLQSYKFYTFSVNHGGLFKRGNMLYVKLVGANCNTSPKGTSADGQGGSGAHRLSSCIALYNPTVSASQRPADALYYEGFDGVNGGVDYFFGTERKRLAGMANYCGEKVSLNGFTVSDCYARPGYVQIGYAETQANTGSISATATGALTTPKFGTTGDVALSFKAAAYRNPAAGREKGTSQDVGTPDNTSIQIEVLGGGTIDGQTTVVITDVNTEAWQTIEKTVVGATADTQIKFTSPSGSTYNRWFLDDILVK